MPLPKSVVKIKKGNVEYISEVDKVKFTITELTRAALRDVGKYLCNVFRTKYYARFKRKTGRVGKYTQYWVRSKQPVPDLLVGIKPSAFYGLFQEIGGKNTEKVGLLTSSASENIDTIRDIESKYLELMDDETSAVNAIDEGEYEGE